MPGHRMAHDLFVHLTVDFRVRRSVQKAPLLHIGKNNASQTLAIDRFIIVENFLTELRADLLPGRFAGFND